MMGFRVQPKEPAVRHVGKPCQGMPVVMIGRCESPQDALKGPSSLDETIFSDVIVIIIGKEIVIPHLPIDSEDGHD